MSKRNGFTFTPKKRKFSDTFTNENKQLKVKISFLEEVNKSLHQENVKLKEENLNLFTLNGNLHNRLFDKTQKEEYLTKQINQLNNKNNSYEKTTKFDDDSTVLKTGFEQLTESETAEAKSALLTLTKTQFTK